MYDSRTDPGSASRIVAPDVGANKIGARNRSESKLRGTDTDFRVTYDRVFSTPSHIRSTTRFLTGYAPSADPMDTLELYIQENSALFVLDNITPISTRILSDYQTKHNGVRHIQLQQTINGLDLIGATLGANFTKNGELINVSSYLLPDSSSISLSAGRNAEEALESASLDIGVKLTKPIARVSSVAQGRVEFLQTSDFAGTPEAELAYFPMSRTDFRLVWKVTVPEAGAGNMYQSYVDASSSEILYRSNMTKYFDESGRSPNTTNIKGAGEQGASFSTEDVTLLIYDVDSPSPTSGTQTRTSISMLGVQNTSANANGWMTDGTSITAGNNVEAYTDVDDDNSPDLGTFPTDAAYRVFDYSIDLTGSPSGYKPASVTQLFFACNYMHDRLWAVGFDEPAGNFQVNNFGHGGFGSDDVRAESQDGGGTNNANFYTPTDGNRPRMQMYLGVDYTPHHDGSFDTHVVFHEYGHGWSIRLVGGPSNSSGLNNLQQMGEGLADFVGLLVLAQPGDENTMAHPIEVGTYLFTSGIRPYPYSTSLAVNPHTYSSIGSGVSVPHGVGSVMSEILWVTTNKLTQTYGYAGFELMLQLITDGLKLCPTSPTFIDLRDAILQADLVNNSGVNLCTLWEGFAERGLGYSASTEGSDSLVAVDGFDVSPVACISSAGVIILDSSDYGCGDTVGIVLADSDLTGASIYDVIIETTTGDSETVTLTEVESGVFSGSITIQQAFTSTENGTIEAENPSATITATYVDADIGSGSAATVTDTASFVLCLNEIYSINLDTSPGWSTQGAWAFGVPLGGGIDAFGYGADPTSGNTGSNVYGYNLAGAYIDNMSATYLTTTAFDFTGVTNVSLKFWRWLNVESSEYDHVSIEANNGSGWVTIWDHTSSDVFETSWSEQSYDISAIADNESSVFIRWVMGSTDFSVFYGGWNIDDISFEGLPPAVTEGWVDFAYTGTSSGSIDKPFKAMADAVATVTSDGVINVKGNTADSDSSETLSGPNKITRPLTINAVGGTIKIGITP